MQPEVEAADGVGTRPSRALSLVVADDSPEVVVLVRTVLGRDPRFDLVGEGADGLQAIRLAEVYRPDVLLMDISMPRLDGVAAANRIRTVSPGTCMVMYTAHDDTGLIEQAMRAGASGVLVKSGPVEELGDELITLWEKKQADPEYDDKRLSSEQLRQSEERFRLLVEAVEDYAIFMLDQAGVVVSWNSGAERINGYTASEIIGRHFRVFYPKAKQEEGYPEYELVQALAHGHFEEEGWRVRKDGSLMWANILITAVYDRDGIHVGFAKVTRDITARRAVQQEREAAADKLAKLNSELGRANQDLAATAEQRSEFLAVTAHELRTPISVIAGSATALSSYWRDLEDFERQELLDTISSSASRLARLLNDLLTAARIESGSMELLSSPVRLSEVLETTVAAAKVQYGEEAPRLAVETDAIVDGDRDRLAQIFDNLVQNAYRHGKPPVEVKLGVSGDNALVSVSDAGEGVSDAARARLFQRYVTGGRRRGTGLGLFIVKELARAHRGDARWDPDARAFVITLPLAAATT